MNRHPDSSRTLLCAAIALALGSHGTCWAADESPADGGDAASAGTVEPGSIASNLQQTEDEDSGLQAAQFMPLGKPNLQVKIPQFKDGQLECVMSAGEMTRIGEDEIDIKSMNIQFLDKGEVGTEIDLLEARYNLDNRMISTDQRAVVRRPGFTLVGDSMEFDTVERRGKMVGKVRMVIYDSSGFMKQDEDPQESAAIAESGEDGEGLSVVEAARLIARVAAYRSSSKPPN